LRKKIAMTDEELLTWLHRFFYAWDKYIPCDIYQELDKIAYKAYEEIRRRIARPKVTNEE